MNYDASEKDLFGSNLLFCSFKWCCLDIFLAPKDLLIDCSVTFFVCLFIKFGYVC